MRCQALRRPVCPRWSAAQVKGESVALVQPGSELAHALGLELAEAIANESAAREVWAWGASDRVELWVLTEPTDADTEQRLYALSAPLDDRHPEVDLRVHVLNPAWYGESDPKVIIPSGAERIALPRR